MSKPYVPPSGYLPVFKPALPYHHLLPDGLQPGTSVYVQGVVSQHAKRFWVNFSCGQHEGANIPFHFNPHFDGNDKIALNTFQDSKWDTEEHHEMPFQNGKHFEIIFIVNNEEYQILVNKNPFFSYKHRMPPQCVQVVSLDGDLEIQSLAVIERPKKGNICMMQKPGGGTPENLMLMDSVIFHPVSSLSLLLYPKFAGWDRNQEVGSLSVCKSRSLVLPSIWLEQCGLETGNFTK
uniref:Galectin n=1 Tax=Naja naja TaxID=35670 RepID=A0A8C6YI76_NAJNA